MKQDRPSQESQHSGEIDPENEEDFSDENNNVIEIQDRVNRQNQFKEILSTNLTSLEENFLSAENISTIEKILKYTDEDPEVLLQQLQEEEEDWVA